MARRMFKTIRERSDPHLFKQIKTITRTALITVMESPDFVFVIFEPVSAATSWTRVVVSIAHLIAA